jgi:hypothetical protein
MFELLPYGATINLQCTSCSKKGEVINNYTSSTTYSTITDDLGKNNCYFLESIQGPTTMTFSYTKRNGTLVGIDTNLTVLNSNFGADGSGSFTITNEGFDPDEHEGKPEGDVIEEIERQVQHFVGESYIEIDFSSISGYTGHSFRDGRSGYPESEIYPIKQNGDRYYFDPKYYRIIIWVYINGIQRNAERYPTTTDDYYYISISNSNNIEKLLDKNNNRNIIPNDKYTIEQNKIIIDSQYEDKTIIIVYNYGESHVINKKAPYIRLLFNKVKVECCFVNVDGLGTYSQNGWSRLGVDDSKLYPISDDAHNYCSLLRYITVSWSTSEQNQLLIAQDYNDGHWYQAFFDTFNDDDTPISFGYGDEHRVWSVTQDASDQDNKDSSKITIPPLNGSGTLRNIKLNKYFKIGYSINFHGESNYQNASILGVNGEYYNYNLLGTFKKENIIEQIISNNCSPTLFTHPKRSIWGENSKFYLTNSGNYISPANGVELTSMWNATSCTPNYNCPCDCDYNYCSCDCDYNYCDCDCDYNEGSTITIPAAYQNPYTGQWGATATKRPTYNTQELVFVPAGSYQAYEQWGWTGFTYNGYFTTYP